MQSAQEILNKPGKLEEEEFESKKHCVIGYQLAESFDGMNEDILKGILQHHEREDGSRVSVWPEGRQDTKRPGSSQLQTYMTL